MRILQRIGFVFILCSFAMLAGCATNGSSDKGAAGRGGDGDGVANPDGKRPLSDAASGNGGTSNPDADRANPTKKENEKLTTSAEEENQGSAPNAPDIGSTDTTRTSVTGKDGCLEGKTVEELLGQTKSLLAGPAEDEIQCARMIVKNSSGEKWSFNFPAQSWKVGIIGPEKQKMSVDLDKISRQAGKGLSFVIRVAYELVREDDSPDAQFAAIASSFPGAEIDRAAKIPDVIKDQVQISKPRSYRTVSGTTVYWGDSAVSADKTTFLVELPKGKYTGTTITMPK